MRLKKQNRTTKVKCSYCLNQATGIIYKPSKDIDNALACTTHATNLFIPFKDSSYDRKSLCQSKYRSPIKNSKMSQMSSIASIQDNPQTFFQNLMQNIIQEYNTMKKQLMTNYHAMKNLKKSHQAVKFRIQGDASYPYMLINNDEQMMMNYFIQRMQFRHSEQTQKKRKQQITKRRIQLCTILSSTNVTPPKSVEIKSVNSLFLSRSVQGSPQKLTNQTSIDKSNHFTTDRKATVYRDYSRTQRKFNNQLLK